MIYYNGANKKNRYFEGWYLKQQTNSNLGGIAFIPGYNIDINGTRTAFVQILTNQGSYAAEYPFSDFYAAKKNFRVRIGKNYFTKKGIHVDLKRAEIQIQGNLHFYDITPLNNSIMGPFSCLPFMECSHEVYSLHHRVNGILQIKQRQKDGKIHQEKIEFSEGTGYIESDCGNSFPNQYFWSQCNDFSYKDFSIMFAAAQIPVCKTSFLGCICVICYQGMKFRIASYLGAKVVYFDQRRALVRQGKFRLFISVLESRPKNLLAPCCGDMNIMVKESLFSKVNYKLFYLDKPVFDITSKKASVEVMLTGNK